MCQNQIIIRKGKIACFGSNLAVSYKRINRPKMEPLAVNLSFPADDRLKLKWATWGISFLKNRLFLQRISQREIKIPTCWKISKRLCFIWHHQRDPMLTFCLIKVPKWRKIRVCMPNQNLKNKKPNQARLKNLQLRLFYRVIRMKSRYQEISWPCQPKIHKIRQKLCLWRKNRPN